MCIVGKHRYMKSVLLMVAVFLSLCLFAGPIYAVTLENALPQEEIIEEDAEKEFTEDDITKDDILEDSVSDEAEEFTMEGENILISSGSALMRGLPTNQVKVYITERVDTFNNGQPPYITSMLKYVAEDGETGDSRGPDGKIRYRYVYCLAHTKDTPVNQTLTMTDYESAYVYHIIYHGAMYYGETSRYSDHSTGNWKHDYLATQMAINIITGQYTLDEIVTAIQDSPAASEDEDLLITAITRMVTNALSAAVHPGFDSDGCFRMDYAEYTSFSLSKSSETWSASGGYYYSGWITPTLTTKNGYYANSDISYFQNNVTSGVTIEKLYSDSIHSPYRLKISAQQYAKWQETGKTVTSNVSVRVPSHWRVARFTPSGGENYQDVCFPVYLSKDQYATYSDSVSLTIPKASGNIKVTKKSADTEISDGNAAYSLAGAVYELYKVADDGILTKQTGTYTTDKNGSFTIKNLNLGTYKLKEITAPAGFELDPEYSDGITVQAGKTTAVTVTDIPQFGDFTISIQKKDADTGLTSPQGKGTFADAEFTVRYYMDAMTTDPALSGKSPEKTWIIKTDKTGYCEVNDMYLLSGDDFFTDKNGEIVWPYGTLTIQETKPPIGYKVNTTVYVSKIDEDSSGSIQHSNIPEIAEKAAGIKIIKKQDGTDTRLQDVTFQLQYPDGTNESAVTDADGEVLFMGLPAGEYVLREISTKDDHILSNDVITFTVNEEYDIEGGTIISANDGTSGESTFEYDSDGNGVITFGNKEAGEMLPETGSNKMMLLIAIGSIFMSSVLLTEKIKKYNI